VTNALYYGDNLAVLRDSIGSESVDLVYLDPPFNSQATYNVLFRSPTGSGSQAQIEAFEDTWHWGHEAEDAFDQVMRSGNTNAADLLRAMRSFLGDNDMMAYLAMMAVRLLELHRVLRPTGSLYLHCDPTASHYLKQLLDGIFGTAHFKNEIIWRRGTPRGHAYTRYASSHDVIFYYTKNENAVWNASDAVKQYDLDHLDDKTDEKYSLRDDAGRRYQLTSLLNPNPDRPNLTYEFLGVHRVWRWTRQRMEEAYQAGLIVQPRPGGVPRFKRYLDEQKGKPIGDIWDDIPPINSQAQERLGYPTQKPVALLERIIGTSSNPGAVVLDPFCGCGTAVHAAEKLGRSWIGIDITHLAISLIERRLKDAFPGVSFEVHGAPRDLWGARDLALRDKYQFQWWAVSLIDAQPFAGKKKGADGGIDGLIYFRSDARTTERAIVSVKGGDNVGVPMIRDLKGVLDRERAPLGVFLTLAPPTRPMEAEAASAGFYELGGRRYPRLQILTIEQALAGTKPAIPHVDTGAAFKRATREEGDKQADLF
jgi:site-specific DNA-methyltransferase (adenine-specific)